MYKDSFQARSIIKTTSGAFTIFNLKKLEEQGISRLSRLPFSIRILLESLLRQCDEKRITSQDVVKLAGWEPISDKRPSIPYLPARVVMQDFTGVPAVVDLAAMRSAL